VSQRTVRRLIASGSIDTIRIGRSVRIRDQDIEKLIQNAGQRND
jgi:excisionase family DNA binding protein